MGVLSTMPDQSYTIARLTFSLGGPSFRSYRLIAPLYVLVYKMQLYLSQNTSIVLIDIMAMVGWSILIVSNCGFAWLVFNRGVV